MAVSLREGRPVRDVEAILERPDGTRTPFMPYPTPLKDAEGKVIGGINLLIEIGDRKRAEIDSARLAAIVDSSDDAIVSKNLNGRVTSWNAGATRIFGYAPEEMIGQPIARIIPKELLFEEDMILGKLRRGERIDHFDTVRVAKDGRRVNISVSVSPLRNAAGIIVGASKVARDITERKRSEEVQNLLFGELNHRVKNTLATIQSLASQSLLRAKSPADFVASFNGRVQALGRAHDLLVRGQMSGAGIAEIVREQVILGSNDARITAEGPAFVLEAQVATHLALVLHELATNARKYGALSLSTGRLSISWSLQSEHGSELSLTWKESGIPKVTAPTSAGFGTVLIERTLEANGGKAAIRYGADGITCDLRLPVRDPKLRPPVEIALSSWQALREIPPQENKRMRLQGKRIMLIEDEPLIAMDIEGQLMAEGCEVIGPAATFASAQKLINETTCDVALVDANLDGHPVDELVAALTKKGIPFAFATGYARAGLPAAFRDAPVLTKPFSSADLFAVIDSLLTSAGQAHPTVVPIRRA